MLISRIFSWFSGKPASGRCGYAEISSDLSAAFDDPRPFESAGDLDVSKQNISDIEFIKDHAQNEKIFAPCSPPSRFPFKHP